MSAVEKPGVLFVCTANSARSVMAEALFRREVGDRFEVASAGLSPLPVHPLTVEVLREVGLDVSGYQPRSVGEFLGRKSFRFVVAVCPAVEKACPAVWPFTLDFRAVPFDDPAACAGTAEERLAVFRSVRDQIRATVPEWAEEFAKVVPFPAGRV